MKILEDLKKYGIKNCIKVLYNPNFNSLFKEEINPNLKGFERCIQTKSGAISVNTGTFTGRSPLDKYLVLDDKTRNVIWWSDNNLNQDGNIPVSTEIWKFLKKLVIEQLSNKKLFVIDAICGAAESSKLKVRFITEVAWQAHFIKNMFIEPSSEELKNFVPEFILFNAAKCTNPKWKEHGLNSENFIVFNFTEKIQIIGGTWYSGEMKKGIFLVMNYLLPLKGIMSMHCSANLGKKDDVALFFGLSGTGKTTLSIDSSRKLIGDDEHGWDDFGVFNFEGGCYAKTINLSIHTQPEIYKAIRKNALLENVTILKNGEIDFQNIEKTENSRVSYPIEHIENIVKPSRSGHAKNIIFLVADAFGVLPILSKLTLEQAQYHFLSGFTTKLAGTERGIKTPIPTFSACFGSPFLSLHPTVYANILAKKIKKFNSYVYLVNTGWNGKGKRISLTDTRNIIKAILNGDINNAPTETLPIFNLSIPKKLPGINSKILDPRTYYKNQREWHVKGENLANLFRSNFKRFSNSLLGKKLEKYGPKLIKND